MNNTLKKTKKGAPESAPFHLNPDINS